MSLVLNDVFGKVGQSDIGFVYQGEEGFVRFDILCSSRKRAFDFFKTLLNCRQNDGFGGKIILIAPTLPSQI